MKLHLKVCPVCGNMFSTSTNKMICCDRKCGRTHESIIKEELLLKRCLSEWRVPYRDIYYNTTPLEVWRKRKTWFTGVPPRPINTSF